MVLALKQGMRRSELEGFVRRVGSGSLILQANIERVSELLLSFKQVAVDSSSAQRRQFELAQLVREILMSMDPTLKRLPVEVSVDIPAGLEMDSYPGALGQVLTNLISNALLHGLEGRTQGHIAIHARRLADPTGPSDRVELSVSDDGAGIPADIQARVFDPFFTTRMGRGGTGLGLNISHNLISNVLCGTISLHSSSANGTCFLIELPLVAPSGADNETILLTDL
jgi:signal transduction histidine kinase